MSARPPEPPPLPPTPVDAALLERWRAAWPDALAVWSRYTRLRDARLCESLVEAAQEGLRGNFAAIRLRDQRVVIDLSLVRDLGLADYAVEILAHEIGHHVLAPASATDHYRLLARIRRALPTLERFAPLVANLYTDLCINDRLQRQSGLRIADIYRCLKRPASVDGSTPPSSGVWTLYMAIYEQLWHLPPGELGGRSGDERVQTDAWLGARLIRVYANDWLTGAGRFATLLLPYLVEDLPTDKAITYLLDTREAAMGCDPSGALDIESDEIDGAIHPAEDPLITGDERQAPAASTEEPAHADANAPGGGQMRDPFEYGELLRAAGINLSDHDIAVRYYRERALPHLVRFPTRPSPESPEPQLEGLETWELGDPLDEIDWLQTAMQSPRIVPGVTTVRRQYGREPGTARERVPVDLDLYVDSSGSMPNPQQQLSYLALAGAVIALSALRTGSRVQTTLWAGKEQVTGTDGFVRDENAVLRVLTGFYGGSTVFPLHRLRDTYAARDAHSRPAHLLMISDDGIITMFDDDERGQSGWTLSAQALSIGRAGGTMALNLPADWEARRWWSPNVVPYLRRAREEQGWDVHAIERMEDLLEFARAFSRRHYTAN